MSHCDALPQLLYPSKCDTFKCDTPFHALQMHLFVARPPPPHPSQGSTGVCLISYVLPILAHRWLRIKERQGLPWEEPPPPGTRPPPPPADGGSWLMPALVAGLGIVVSLLLLLSHPFLPYVAPRFCHISGFDEHKKEKNQSPTPILAISREPILPICHLYITSVFPLYRRERPHQPIQPSPTLIPLLLFPAAPSTVLPPPPSLNPSDTPPLQVSALSLISVLRQTSHTAQSFPICTPPPFLPLPLHRCICVSPHSFLLTHSLSLINFHSSGRSARGSRARVAEAVSNLGRVWRC